MKKKMCVFLMAIFMLCYSTTLFAAESESQLGDISSEYDINAEGNVLVVSQKNFSSETDYGAFLEGEGIIVVLHDKGGDFSLNEELNVPFSLEDVDGASGNGNMAKIATLYYNYLGAIGIRDVYVEEVEETQYEVLIAEEVNYIKVKIENQTKTVSDVVPYTTTYATTYIGEYTNSYTYKPKMRFEVDYDFYTVQDYTDGKDYYSVIGNVFGNSGRAMTDLGESGYESKYETDNLIVTFESKTTGFTREEYGPSRTVGSNSYSFNIGASFGKNVSVNTGFSSSYSIADTDINVSSSSTKTVWTVEYKNDAQKQTSEFHPAITMSCSSSTSSVQMYIDTSYQVDSWNTLPDTRNFSTTITFYPNRISNT